MGTSTDRITAAHFLTPPELRGLCLATDGAGRIGGVRLELNGTRLRSCYQQVPLRVLPPFHFGPDQPALLYLLNPTTGLLDGDAHLIELSAAAGTRAVVVGQSATRLHPCPTGFCTQQWRITVAEGAVLVLLPGPAIPFQGARYYQRIAIDLAETASVILGDVWLAGRCHRGAASERFQFRTIVQELMVKRGGVAVYRDRFCWRGPWDGPTATWHFGPHPAAGTLFAAGPRVREVPLPDAAAFGTEGGDLCVRWQGEAEDVTRQVVATALRAASRIQGDSTAEPWLLGRDELAPNHWFTLMVPGG
jgi:urease accessory protein